MPRGTCEVCGCTEFRACEGGCTWIDTERTLCSQCAGWVLLRLPNAFEGIMPYDLWPARTTNPLHTRTFGTVWPVDVRRMTVEQLERTAFVAAPMLGYSVDDFRDNAATGREPFVMGGRSIRIACMARNVEDAHAQVDEWLRTGSFSRGAAVAIFNRKGDRHRG